MRGARQRLRECTQSQHRTTTTGLSGTGAVPAITAAARTGTRTRARAGNRCGTGTVVSDPKL